ncbi:MAG: hypothetical protein KDA90_05915 [Planctomycetaceae bacterium]|nr:hypothetical protein [Planctomycetaceae bacterium]
MIRQLVAVITLCCGLSAAQGAPIELSEPFTQSRPLLTRSEVRTTGKVFALNAKGQSEPLDLSATAVLQFRSRRLAPSGRDAAALREAREFEIAQLDTTVAGHQTRTQLPAQLKRVVTTGQRDGLLNYCPQVLMTREALDLLDMPGDPLALIAMLPQDSVETGATWAAPDWAGQMLAGIDTADAVKCDCTLTSANDQQVVISIQATVSGQRLGSASTVTVTGTMHFSPVGKFISGASLTYAVKSEVGTINPGLEAQIVVNITRQIAPEPGLLTDEYIASLPLEPNPAALELVFDAIPWGLRLLHDRSWHLFQAVYEGQHPVAILRLMNSGSLICQCNIAPVTAAQPGQRTPPEQFEQDISQSLGSRLQKLSEQEEIPLENGRFLYRVVAEGEVELKGDDKTLKLPMNWIYYLSTNADGRQTSFVFAVEPHLRETLADRDRQLMMRLSYFGIPK